MVRRLGICFITLFSLTVLCHGLEAQVNTATLIGTVRDSSGAVVAGASVTARNLGTSLIRTATTDATGNFSIPDLAVGHYSLTATFSGFKTITIADIELQVAQVATVNPVLQVGSSTETVTVSGQAPLLATASSSVGQVVDTRAVESMPLNGRNFWQLTQLTPGASYTPGGQNIRSGGSSIRATIVNVNVNGTAPIWTGWSLDGSNITEFQLGGTLIQPNVDALQEFKVEGANMDAEYGHTPTTVNATLKSGTNDYHGVIYEFLRNNALDARNFFFVPPPGSSSRNESLHRNQFGGTFGGPIKRERTFYFVDFENMRLSQAQNSNNVVPSPAERGQTASGDYDFSELLQGSNPVHIVNPVTGNQFDGNIIPASAVSRPAKFLLPYIPPANVVVGTTYRAVVTSPLTQDLKKGDVKIDEQLRPSDHLMGRYSISNNDESDPNPFPAIGHFPLHSRAQNIALTWTHIFSPDWLNELRLGYYRSYFLFGGALQGTNIDQQAGILGFNASTVQGFPQIAISGFTSFTGSPSDQRPKQNRIRDWQYGDNLRYSKGKHNLKFGASVYHQTNTFIAGLDSVGNFTFSGIYSKNAFADFLLGYPANVSRSDFRELWGNSGNFQGYYLQDNYRLTSDLTLNLGLRYEVSPFYDYVRGQGSAFDFQTQKLILPTGFSLTAQPSTTIYAPLFEDRIELTEALGLPPSIRPTNHSNWAPRVGLAWKPFGSNRWVLRSAYGIFYVFPDDNTINNTQQTVPFTARQTVVNDKPPSRTFEDYFQGQPIIAANPRPGQPCAFGFVANSCSTPDITAGPVHVHNAYLQEWNLSVQYEITPRLSLDVAYVGNHTTHLQQFIQRNDPPPGPGPIQPRRPFPQWGALRSIEWGGRANYHSLQTKVESRNWHGATFLSSYTYSKCLDDGSSEQGATALLIPVNYGVCNFDLKHNFVFSSNYELPIGKGKAFLGDLRGWRDQLFGGWQIASIITLQSGLPFTPTIGGSANDNANTNVGSQRPNLIGKPTIVGNPQCWFYTSLNPSCMALRPGAQDAFAVPAQNTYGTAGRNILREDGLVQLDFNVMKAFQLAESKSLQFRSEFFNITNTTTFAAPSTNVNLSSGAQVGSTLNAARTIELALKFIF